MENTCSFNWDIHWACNYNCPYCWFHDQWPRLVEKNKYFKPDVVIERWENIYKLCGKSKVSITGGEPLAYHGFSEIIKAISKVHEVEVITNLSYDINSLADEIKGRDITINPSFHPLSADKELFLQRVIKLLNYGLMKTVSIVAWPPFVRDIPKYKEYFMTQASLFADHSAAISIQPFNGEYNGKIYPRAYSIEELQIINNDMGRRGGKEFSVNIPKTNGRLCNAGKKYAVIQPNGTVQRCGSIGAKDCNMGNFFDTEFALFEKPLECSSDSCVCNEWAFLLE